jgi:hypothetical protein
MFYVFGTPPPVGALSPTAGFIRNKVDFAKQQFVYTNEQRLQLVGPLFDNYGSLAALRDLSCGLAGRDDRARAAAVDAARRGAGGDRRNRRDDQAARIAGCLISGGPGT